MLTALAALAGCGGNSKSAASVPGSWSGTCTISGTTYTALALTTDGAGHVSGTLTNVVEGGTASLAGTITGNTLNASYTYASGATGSVQGTLATVSPDEMTASMTIAESGKQYVASCDFKRISDTINPVSSSELDAFCSLYGNCAGYTMSSSELQMCRQMALPILQLMPDPDYSKACFQRITCDQLQNDAQLQAAVTGCLNLDNSTVACAGSTLHGCTKTGKCTDVDCTAACTAIGYGFAGCIYDSAAGHQKCGCGTGGPAAPDAGIGLPMPDAGLLRPVPDAAPPAPCARVGLVRTTNACDMALRGSTLFVADGTGGLKIVDAASSLAASVIGTYPAPGALVAVTTDERYVYAFDTSAGLLIIDAANPAAPTLVGSLHLANVSSNIPMPPASPGEGGIALAGARAYVGGTWGTGLCTVDVSVPSAPQLVGECSTESALTRAGNFVVQGSFLYATAIFEFVTVNVANPGGPLVIASFEPSQTVVQGSPAFFGTYVLLPGMSGAEVLSLTSPTSPVSVSVLAQSASAATAAGSFVLLASYAGLQFIDLAAPTQPRILGSCTSSGSSASGAKLLVDGNHAYLAAGSDGVSIWDLYPERLAP